TMWPIRYFRWGALDLSDCYDRHGPSAIKLPYNCLYRLACTSTEYSSTAIRRQSADNFARSSSLTKITSSCWRKPAGSSEGARRPVMPCRTTSGRPPTEVATTGTPQAMASITTLGKLSARLGQTSTSAAESANDISRLEDISPNG